MDDKRFKMVDEEFICSNCSSLVKPLGYTARNHCPVCLHSVHLDINPGDRNCSCKGLLIPVGVEKTKKDMYKIIYKCDKCGMIKRNIQANDDNIDEIIKLSVISD